ncbi:hypothetical protein OHO83_09775 [Streptomyces sp. NBC_00569]|uniref:hypothetical protein n=1 Tax=Streptomyces sp. NBC_00569 TaxID=2975780 RepID=UPI002E804227|nr:hypothetical protein [Streptomyces sp. NBC_00569]WUB92569.1 hypothetical protein OHO83_09775 [Streptomyces sp. NBC_00569]
MTSNNKTARTLSWTGATVALALFAAGCSPPERPLVAIGRGQDGNIRALLRPCSDDDPIQEVGLVKNDKKGDKVDPAALDYWSAQPPAAATGEQEFSLFGLPKGWQGKAVSATKLAPDRDYSVWFVVGPNDTVRYKGVAWFTRADVEGLSPGQWWADGKAMSRSEFRAQADDAC